MIRRDLPNDEYQGAVNSNNPSASNPFATENDLGAYIPLAGTILESTSNQQDINAGVGRVSNVVTINTIDLGGHGYITGQLVRISVSAQPSFDGDFIIASTPTATSFTYAQVGGDEALAGFGDLGDVFALVAGAPVTGVVDSVAQPDTLPNFNLLSFITQGILNALVFAGLADVLPDFVSASGVQDDDGKIPYYNLADQKYITSEAVTHGTVIINAKTSVPTSTIAKGIPVYTSGFDADLHVVELADADGAGTFPCIGFTATALDDSTSNHVITFGKITGLNTTNAVTTLNPNGETWLQGDSLFLSKTPGGLTKVRPTGVTEIQRIAQILRVHVSGGQLFIYNTARTAGLPNLPEGMIWEGDANGYPVESLKLAEIYKYAIGSIVETIDVTVTESVGVVSLNVEKLSGGDITLIYSDGLTNFDCTPIKSIVLTLGTDTVPKANYVYILKSTGLLTVSDTGFPSTEHIPIADTTIQSASGVSSDGPYKLHVWTDHTSLEGDNGHISHQNSWIRSQHATYVSGVDLNTTITVNGGALDNLDVAITSGKVRQLHEHVTGALDTSVSDSVFVINDPSVPYTKYSDLNLIIQDAIGTSLRVNNDRYVLVAWCIANETGTPGKLMINLPTGKYTGGGIIQDNNAIVDSNKTANYTIPSGYVGTGFLVKRIVVKYTTAGSGTLTILDEEYLRGQLPTVVAGGTTSNITEFPDSTFKVFNAIDSSKTIDIDVSGVTTATERTLTVQDKSGTIALLSDLTLWKPPTVNVGDASVLGTSVILNAGAGKYYSLDGASDDIIVFNWNLNHSEIDYDGSNIAIELEGRLSSNGGGGDTVGLLLDYAFVTAGDNSSTTVTNVAQQNIDVSTEIQDENFFSDLATIAGTTGDTMLLITITRNSTGASADAYIGDYELIGLKLKKI